LVSLGFVLTICLKITTGQVVYEAFILPGSGDIDDCQSVHLRINDSSRDAVLLKHEIYDHEDGIIPFGFVITSAVLQFRVSDVSQNASGAIYEMKRAWDETTWGPGTNSTGPVRGVDYSSEPIGYYGGLMDGDESNITITDSVVKWLNPQIANHGWIIISDVNHKVYSCESSSPPIVFAHYTPPDIPFECGFYKDEPLSIWYPEPFLAHTRFCVVCRPPPIWISFVEPSKAKDTTTILNGKLIPARSIDPRPDWVVGICLSVPPDFTVANIEIVLRTSHQIGISMQPLSYSTDLPNEIGCDNFECSNDTVVINSTVSGEIYQDDVIQIFSDTTINGDFEVQGSITLDQTTQLEIKGCLNISNSVTIKLMDNETYTDGQEITEIGVECDVSDSMFLLSGGKTARPCEKLRPTTKPSSSGVLLVVSVDKDGCDVSSSSSDAALQIIVPATVGGVVLIALLIGVIIFIVRWQRVNDFSLTKVMSRSRSMTGTIDTN